MTDTLQDYFDEIIELYPSVRLTRYKDKLVYKCQWGYAKQDCDEMNDLIEKCSLPLVAKTHASYDGLFVDSFIVQSVTSK